MRCRCSYSSALSAIFSLFRCGLLSEPVPVEFLQSRFSVVFRHIHVCFGLLSGRKYNMPDVLWRYKKQEKHPLSVLLLRAAGCPSCFILNVFCVCTAYLCFSVITVLPLLSLNSSTPFFFMLKVETFPSAPRTACSVSIFAHIIRVLATAPKSILPVSTLALSAPVMRLQPVLPYMRFSFVSKPMNGGFSLSLALIAFPSTSVMFHSPASADIDLILLLVAHDARSAVMHTAKNTFFMSVCLLILIINDVYLNNLSS